MRRYFRSPREKPWERGEHNREGNHVRCGDANIRAAKEMMPARRVGMAGVLL